MVFFVLAAAIAAVGAVALLGLPLAGAIPARRAKPEAHAHVCLTLTTYQAGAPSTSGPHCQSALDQWAHICPTAGHVQSGYGASMVLCLPDPPVTDPSRRSPW